jgi:hypothetical protein
MAQESVLMGDMEQDTIKGMLQVIEHLLDTVTRTSTLAGQLMNAEKAGSPLAPATLAYYEQQLADLDRQREQLRGLIARWWTLLEEGRQ